MATLFSHALGVLSRLLFALRSVCSLRRLVILLPAGKAAPRLDIQWSNGRIGGLCQLHSGDAPSATDEAYTTTTCVTDFDVESPFDLEQRFNSSPKRCHLLSDKVRRTHGEENQSDRGLLVDAYPEARAPSLRVHARSLSNDCAHRSASPAATGFTTPVVVPQKVPPQRKRSRHLTRGQRAKKCHGCTQPSVRSFAGLSKESRKALSLKSSKQHSVYSDRIPESERPSSEDSDAEMDPHSFHRLCDAKRINQLEMEMFQLRSQLARLLLAQEGKRLLANSSEEFDQRLDGDGESDAGPVDVRDAELSHPTVSVASETSETAQLPIATSSSSLPPPPPPPLPPPVPPPPPPPSPAAQFDWRAQLIAARKKKDGTDSVTSIQRAQTPQKAADMGQVLRELQSGAIKLRAVPRSPGGTPVRSHPSPQSNDTDPCSIIARALKNKFGVARSVLNASSSGGENTQGSSFCESPQLAEMKPATASQADTVAPFGKHLLRPVVRTNRNAV